MHIALIPGQQGPVRIAQVACTESSQGNAVALGGEYLHFIQAPSSSKAASILARVRVANHAFLLALDVVAVPLIAQQGFHGGLAVVQVFQSLKQGGHSQRL